MICLQPLDSTGGNAMLPPEGINAAGNLFALIVESELKGSSDMLPCRFILAFLFCNQFLWAFYLVMTMNVICDIAAASSALTDDVEGDYLQSSISGMGKR